MSPEERMQQWQQKSTQAAQAMQQWRQTHPRATLAEIERAVDEQMNQLRASMIEEVAKASPSEQAEKGQRESTCPQCGKRMQARGKHQRKLQTQGGQSVTLTRQYQSCPFCGYSFFPLDEELDLPSTALLPHAHRTLVRLGAKMPFEEARAELQETLGIQLSDSTVRRLTLQAGSIVEQIQTEQAQAPRSPCRFSLPLEQPAERLAISSDGGLVPLRGGIWAEVKTLVIGEVLAPTSQETTARTTAHSYFSRMTDAATFADLASGEIERRGVERAKAVCAVQDGAEWLQGFVDGHRHDAVRILDFAHAAHYLGQVAKQGKQAGHHLPTRWLSILLHQLKHHGPSRVLAHLERLEQRWQLPAIAEALRYFRKRLPQLQYPGFLAAGWPIGSGMVESANKVVMQARLKGAGMHWEPSNVNPMLALRNALRNERWQETWQMQQSWRKDARHSHRQLRCERRRARLLQALAEQVVRFCLLLPRLVPPAQPSSPIGRTEAQRRWGRQTISPKALPLRHAKI